MLYAQGLLEHRLGIRVARLLRMQHGETRHGVSDLERLVPQIQFSDAQSFAVCGFSVGKAMLFVVQNCEAVQRGGGIQRLVAQLGLLSAQRFLVQNLRVSQPLLVDVYLAEVLQYIIVGRTGRVPWRGCALWRRWKRRKNRPFQSARAVQPWGGS